MPCWASAGQAAAPQADQARPACRPACAVVLAELRKGSPLRGTAIAARDIAQAMLFLASDMARCVNVSRRAALSSRG